MNQKNCRSCPHIDVNEMSDEMYCKLKDYEPIRLKWHKHRPDWCPLVMQKGGKMYQINDDIPLGCIYESEDSSTKYCPMCNHDDVPYCQWFEDEPEAAIGIDERPVYCPILPSAQPEPCEDAQHILDYLDNVLHPLVSPEHWNVYSELHDMIAAVPSAQPETYKEKLNEIASALSEKFAYMNTCLNERDIILGYLGVKRCCETHCNTDCTNTKCESHPLSSVHPEHRWIPVTKDTLPEEGKVVIVKGLKGTWDFGTYRGFGHINGEENIHRWQWKKNTYKSVYWWMYKDGALPEPYREEGDE